MRTERALDRLATLEVADRTYEMQLTIALGVAIFDTRGPQSDLPATTEKALAIAEAIGPGAHMLPALWGIIRERCVDRDYQNSFELIEPLGSIAVSYQDESAGSLYPRMRALILHLVGQQRETTGRRNKR